MRHLKGGRKLGRTADARQTLMRSLAIAMLKHEQIRTTLPKARELRRFVEPFVTRARTDSVANRRLIFSRLRDQEVVDMLFRVYGPRYRHRPGGYTRVVKIGFRNGDSAPMALIQFVDQDDAIDATSRPVVVEAESRQPAPGGEKAATEAAAAIGEGVEAEAETAADEAAETEAVEVESPAAQADESEAVEAESAQAEAAEAEIAEAEAQAAGTETPEAEASLPETAETEASAEATGAEAVAAEPAAGAAGEESATAEEEGDRAAGKKKAMSAIEAKGVKDGALDKNDPLMSAMYSDNTDSGEDSQAESAAETAASDADGKPSDKDRQK